MHFYPGLTPWNIPELTLEQYRGYVDEAGAITQLIFGGTPEPTRDELKDELAQEKHPRVKMPRKV